VGALQTRLAKLEAASPRASEVCARCGLEHARRVTIAEARMMVRVVGGTEMPLPAPGTARPGPFCLCQCCAEFRALARVTHGLSPRDEAA
jgi:hypothetical protein